MTKNLPIQQSAYGRILCVCCPRKVRRKYRRPLRYRSSRYMGASMVLAPATVTYATVNQQDMFNI